MGVIVNKRLVAIIVSTLLTTTVLPVTGFSIFTHSDDVDMLVRVEGNSEKILLPRSIEVLGGRSSEWVHVIIPRSQLSLIADRGYEYTIIIDDVAAHDAAVRGSYHTFAEVETMLANIAATYPTITSLYSIGSSYQGRDIWCLEITDNPGVDEGEAGVFYMGLHHAREWPSLEICLYIADQLTSLYGSDPEITNVVDNRRLWLVPCVNPDGYYYDHDQGNDWRKNRHYFPDYDEYGVDLNRNYGGSSDGNPWGSWGSIGPGSVTHNAGYSTYCGPGAFSELEIQPIRDLFINNNISASISWHTWQESVLYPWGYTFDQTPDDTYLSQVAQQIAQRITQQDGFGTYIAEQSAELYPTTGDTTDWSYGYYHYIKGAPLFTYTIEACNDFHPSSVYLDQIVEENFDGALYLLQEAENIKNTVTPRVIPPVIDELIADDDGNYTITWEEQNPEASPEYFQLDEFSDLTMHTDDAESDASLWDLDGFSVSTSQSHSSSHSYKSRNINEDVSAMTSAYPLPVTSGMSLSFWCWYDIEYNWDYAFVEVSRDGRAYDILDTFTGSSSGWQYNTYDLSDYAGESIYIRFRHTTDSYTLETGIYVDDISPVPEFGTVSTLSSTIVNTSYDVLDQLGGDYYYQVRGYNSEHAWGDFSALAPVTVMNNVPPYTPHNPSPSDTETLVPTNTNLVWGGGDPNTEDIIMYDIFFGASPVPPLYGTLELVPATQLTLTLPVTDLAYNTTYYWRISASDGEETVFGPIWEFTTAPLCGDANNDGILNISDAVYVINYVFIPESPTPNPICTADVNGDGVINVSDAVYLINYVLVPGAPTPVSDCCG